MMKVWLDWDSGPYETVSDKPISHGTPAEISEEDWQDYQEVIRRYDRWQNRLEKMRKELSR